jgi:P-type conjugative transfer protein TrbJ
MRTRTCVLLGCLLLPRLSLAGGLPVFDAALNTLGIQEQWIQLKELYESVQHTANQIKQLENQARQITGMYTQIDQGIRNLASLDVHNLQDLYGFLHQLESKLHQAEYIGYQAQAAVGQAQQLYPRIQGVLSADQQRTLNLHWATMRRNSAQVAISTQAIRDAQMRYQQQWADLINRAQGAVGNVQVLQAQVQAQGVIGHQLLAIEQQLATQARERSERAMEMATRAEMEQHLMDKSLAPLDGVYVPEGRLLPMPRTGRE